MSDDSSIPASSGSGMTPSGGPSRPLDQSLVDPLLGEVNLKNIGSMLRVSFTIPPQSVPRIWQTGVAIDGSTSMARAYGRALEGKIPDSAFEEYREKGWLREKVIDGRKVRKLAKAAETDAIARDFLRYSTNEVQTHAREFIRLLARDLDIDGGTSVIYWACGDGGDIETLGEVRAAECDTLSIPGPAHLGKGTRLLPALSHFVDRFGMEAQCLFVFITDGRIDDMELVKQYTKDLAFDILGSNLRTIKCVLIGLGDQIDIRQMQELDDLDTGVPLDVWDHKIAASMRDLTDIFAEVVDQNQIATGPAKIRDAFGSIVAEFPKGMTAHTRFFMQDRSTWFDIEIEGDAEPIRQRLTRD